MEYPKDVKRALFITGFMIIIIIALALFFLSGKAQTQGKFVTGYYQDYGVCAMPPAQVDFSAMTHIIYFHTDVSTTIAPYFLPVVSPAESIRIEWSNSNQGCARTSGESYQHELIRLAHAAGVKVMLCIGGIYGSGDTRMEQIFNSGNTVLDDQRMDVYSTSIVDYLIRKGFDGVDVDWEFPDNGIQFSKLIKLIKTKMNARMPGNVLSIAVYGDYSSKYNVADLNTYVDQVNCMTYDMWNNQGTVWIDSPLGKKVGSPAAWRTWRVNSALSWAKVGVQKSRLANGIPFYSWRFSNVTALGQPLAGYSYAIYKDAVNALALPGAVYHWDDSAKAPYVTYTQNGTNYLISYDDTMSVRYKVERIKSDGMGGVMIYGLWDGWLSGNPVGQRDPLLQAVKRALTSTPQVTASIQVSNSTPVAGSVVTVTGVSSSPVALYDLYIDSVFYQRQTSAPASFLWSAQPAGAHRMFALVQTTSGQWIKTPTINLTVQVYIPPPPPTCFIQAEMDSMKNVGFNQGYALALEKFDSVRAAGYLDGRRYEWDLFPKSLPVTPLPFMVPIPLQPRP